MEPNNRYAAYYQQHPPSFPQEPVHPFLKTWATGRGPSRLMVREGTTAWTAIEALNNKTAIVNTASETAMVDEGVAKVLDALKTQGAGRRHTGRVHIRPGGLVWPSRALGQYLMVFSFCRLQHQYAGAADIQAPGAYSQRCRD
jgi:hypothetical protein